MSKRIKNFDIETTSCKFVIDLQQNAEKNPLVNERKINRNYLPSIFKSSSPSVITKQNGANKKEEKDNIDTVYEPKMRDDKKKKETNKENKEKGLKSIKKNENIILLKITIFFILGSFVLWLILLYLYWFLGNSPIQSVRKGDVLT
ncbi:hypothetical protein EDEG_00624 [Edhazardia aedis USNM 41457]|uniref:Uncharacterized protein n=1 Tax=Edhazardia aedis (strain USNM 41457) TaxID=1003232 RepID=J9DC53_EDHAE|nr:hypothetical protein EDEG_00624 [Edhazardia aedis USNM 41457]|eukprot:EJW05321.1 hypothetical protein EDEG_00624 [Edhazardia aedis USNM 41457]